MIYLLASTDQAVKLIAVCFIAIFVLVGFISWGLKLKGSFFDPGRIVGLTIATIALILIGRLAWVSFMHEVDTALNKIGDVGKEKG